MVVVGKTIGGGIPAAAFGLTAELSARVQASVELPDIDVGGVGGTLAGNALSMAAVRATLTEVLTDDVFVGMAVLAGRWADGVQEVLDEFGVPWQVTRLGGRAEYAFAPHPPRTGGEAAASDDFELQQYLHLQALNRRVLLTPFHNMALISPATTAADVASTPSRSVRRCRRSSADLTEDDHNSLSAADSTVCVIVSPLVVTERRPFR